jgi:MoxR-like ATPase
LTDTARHTPDTLRSRSEAVASGLPALMADAQHLAATILLGVHGRKRAGTGDEFWQYRPAQAGDPFRQIDWRRSARSDGHFIRQTEWQAAQSVMIGVDDAASMTFAGSPDRPSKLRRSQTLAMALAILAVRGGERVGLTHLAEPPRGGQAHLARLAAALMDGHEAGDYGAPRPQGLPAGSRAVFFSDFLGDPAAIENVLGRAADREVKGALVQVLDPVEEAFPYTGRTVFESMSGSLRFETLKAKSLRDAYLDRLAARKAQVQEACRRTGWRYYLHHTDQPAEPALLWLYRALEKGRGA